MHAEVKNINCPITYSMRLKHGNTITHWNIEYNRHLDLKERHRNTIKQHKNTRDTKMNADLMHARIERQKYATPEKYGNCYQLENSSGRIDRRSVPETAPIEAPWPLNWNG
jgi:hypothetical protein